MNAEVLTTAILALAVLLGSARTLWLQRQQDADRQPRAWRTGALLLAQAASAALLYFVLFPTPVPREAGTLVVLTANAGEVPAPERAGERVVALPEFDPGDASGTCTGGRFGFAVGAAAANCPPGAGVERVPDLASALRRYPATERLRVMGVGLVARDRHAARGRHVDFHAAPLPRGLVELRAPTQVPAGRRFEIAGRGERLEGGSAELRDPAGHRVDRVALDDGGHFELHATTRSAGLASYRLQLRDARAQVVEDLAVPLEVTPSRPLRVFVLAGAPNPELKFLRRWALDAGTRLDTRINLGAGVQIGTAPVAFNADALARLDLLVLDGRSWRSLGSGQRDALQVAIDQGLGLLLRLDGPSTRADRDNLRALGFTASTRQPSGETRLGDEFADIADDEADALPALAQSGLHVEAADGVPLVLDAAGTAVGVWRAHGRGRVGVSTLDDTYRLVLAGRPDVHGQLWSRAFTTLARPAAAGADVRIDAAAPGQRSVICGVDNDASVTMPGGGSVPLHVDPASGADRCAGFWAEAAGWHRLDDGDNAMLFHVRAADSAPGLAAHAQREATQALVAATPALGSASPGTRQAIQAGPRWPWFIAWLLLTSATWWFERARWGTRRPQPAPRRNESLGFS